MNGDDICKKRGAGLLFAPGQAEQGAQDANADNELTKYSNVLGLGFRSICPLQADSWLATKLMKSPSH